MRGQRLFIRPIESGDRGPLEAFLRDNGSEHAAPAFGLVGKLVGELVAVVTLDVAGDEVRISDIVVARDLRRKRIGRFMLEEAGRMAEKMDRGKLVVVDPPPGARGFFHRLGFTEESGRLVRTLKSIFAVALLSFAANCARPAPTAPTPAVSVAPPAEQLPATLDDAAKLRAEGKLREYEDALRALTAAGDAATSRRARALLGLHFFEQKRWDEAIAALTSAAASNPAVASALRLRIADAESQRGRFADAASVASSIIATSPDSAAATSARLRLPALHARLGDAAATETAFAQAMSVAIDEVTEPELVTLAGDLESAQRADLAAKVWLRLLTDYTQGRFTEKSYSALATRHTAVLESLPLADLVAIASKLGRADRYDQALGLLGRIARLHPTAANDDLVRATRIRSLFNSRNYARLLEETHGVTLNDPALQLLRARAAWRNGQPEAFLDGLRQLEREFPSSKEAVDARVFRARYYMTDERRFDLAAYNLMTAIEAGAPGNGGENLWTLGWVYTLARRDAEALATFARYLGQYPDADYTSNSLFWSAKVHERNGRISERDAALNELIRKYPYGYFGYRAREILALSGAPPAPPSSSAGEAAGAPPSFPDVGSLLSGIDTSVVDELLAISLGRDAVREMKAIAAKHPENLGVAFRLADVYARGGEPFRANGVLQRRFREFVRHGGIGIPDRFWEILFPLRHWETIRAEAEKRGLDPYLLASIIRQESGFEPTVVSNAGAVGLMQIMPNEAPEIALQAGLHAITREELFDPGTNITVGAAEYAQKLARMNGNHILAIAAYNAGEQAVGRWIAQSPVYDIDLFVESIPYAETRLYVKSVTRNRFEYRRIYERSTSSPDQQAATR